MGNLSRKNEEVDVPNVTTLGNNPTIEIVDSISIENGIQSV